jgi:hypothetical protein
MRGSKKDHTPGRGRPTHDGPPNDPPPDRPKPSGSDDEERRERVRGQVKIVLEALGPNQVEFHGPTDDPADFEYICRSGHILVRDSDLARVLRELEGSQVADSLIGGVTLVALPAGETVPTALAKLERTFGRGVATPDHVLYVTGSGTCCPAKEPELPGKHDPDPEPTKDAGDGSGVLVSVVDTGWHSPAATHPLTPWLAGVTGDEENIDPNNLRPYAGHGTFIAGVVRCIAPAAQVRVEGFLPNGGAVFESRIVVQLYQSLSQGPDVISLSAGARTRNQHPLLGFDAFYENGLRHQKGTVLVAAAGNDGDRVPFWPAAFPWTVSVGALEADGSKRADYSNFGSWVDLYAVGSDLVNAFPTGTYTCKEPPNVGEVRKFDGLASWSGTSFATPTVAGIIAARMSATGESARAAADALIALGSKNAIPGIGSVLSPGPQNLP